MTKLYPLIALPTARTVSGTCHGLLLIYKFQVSSTLPWLLSPRRSNFSPYLSSQCICSTKLGKSQHTVVVPSPYIVLASFPGLHRSFCSSVCVDNNTQSGEERGRPGIIHHVSDVRWTRGGRIGGGARSRFSRS